MFVERRGNNLLLRRCLGSDACNSALLMSKEGGSSAERAEMLATISWVFERTGERRKAIESREAALAIYRATGDPNGEMGALHALGQFALESGDLVTARSWIEKAVEMAEVMRVKAWSHRLQSTYMASRQKVYESYIDLLMQMRLQEPEKGYERIALQVSERARSLLDLLAEGRAQIRQGADPALLEKERHLLERLNAKDAAWKELSVERRLAPGGGVAFGADRDVEKPEMVVALLLGRFRDAGRMEVTLAFSFSRRHCPTPAPVASHRRYFYSPDILRDRQPCRGGARKNLRHVFPSGASIE